MELFLFYVIGLTLVSFISIILTENPLPISQLPHSKSDLEFSLIPLRRQPQELVQRIDLIGAAIVPSANNQRASGESSLAELTASPSKAIRQEESVY